MMMSGYRNTFHKLFMESYDLLPDAETRHLFAVTVAGALAVHLDQSTIEHCIELALETSQAGPVLELVKK